MTDQRLHPATVYLEIIQGFGRQQRWFPQDGVSHLGRHADCDLVLDGELVSRQHVRLTRKKDRLILADLNSRNGTKVNEVLIESPTELQRGDRISIGDYVLEVGEESIPGSKSHSGEATRTSIITTTKSLEPDFPQVPFNNQQQKLSAVLDLARSLGKCVDETTVFPEVLESLLRVFPQADHAVILLFEEQTGEFVFQAECWRDDRYRVALPNSQTLLDHIVEHRQAVLSADVTGDDRFLGSTSLDDLGILSVMCVPLISPGEKLLGALQTETHRQDLPFTDDDLDVLCTLALLAARIIEHNRLLQRMIELDRQERELTLAQTVQRHFLPQSLPQLDGYEFFQYYRPADAVGGDYYDFFELPNGHWAIALGDVSGHGVAAALLMARLGSENRYCLATESAPESAIATLNRQLNRQLLHGRFVTLVVCLLDISTHELTCINAGHIPPLLRRGDGELIPLIEPEDSGPPLGVLPEFQYPSVSTHLSPGDVVVLLTDGITETFNEDQVMYGEKELRQTMQTSPHNAKGMGEAILAGLTRFSESSTIMDDRCLVCLSRDRSEDVH
ncbi:MAG: SpoIIE family protein phosphatase [Planctomycetaceae bacterium]|nr:SpoIIE family protein phosphatase [Planctomycetaceae bacterium]